jgi:hypothetical protein
MRQPTFWWTQHCCLTKPGVRMWVGFGICGIAFWAGGIGASIWWTQRVVVSDVANRAKDRHRQVLDQTTSYSSTNSAAASIPDFLHSTVHALPTEMWTVATATAYLRSRGFRVCSEELQRGLHEQPRLFRLSTSSRALHEVLDDVVAGDPSYRWDFVTNSDIVNVVPIRSRLDVALQVPGDEQRRLINCVGELHQPGKLHYSDFLLGNFKDPGRIENWPFTVRESNVLARDYLNQLAGQYDGMSWHVTSGTSVYFEVNPPELFDSVAEKLRAEVRLRDNRLRQAAEKETAANGDR